MQAQSSAHDLVVISRDTRGETVNGKPRPARVYVTGPHFGHGVYSSRDTKVQAVSDGGVFDRAEAERLLAQGKWRGHNPQIELADE